MKSVVMCVAIVMAFATASLAQEAPRTLAVVGEGSAEAAPDMAVISLGVTHTDASAKAAMDRVSADASALLSTLSGMGVEPRDVQTDQLSISPLWNNDEGARDITGFVARNSLSVRVRNIGALGAVLDAALSAGSNDFNGLRFQLQDSTDAKAEARAAAVADAIARATQLAEAAGVTLGPIQTITEQGDSGMRPEMFAAARASDMPVAPGELSLSARVSVTFDLIP
ncbi:SIMPL domain-containing protein [Tateyamaria sp. SN3-11]|uniref:SIMPL domain-containing protein n=1 Tax=Tateyamaria sp. SN3-11 TaxID=3092147 RepID=UPI0039EC92B6